MSFFGSRIRGQETANSDVDFIIFKHASKGEDINQKKDFDIILNEKLKSFYKDRGIKAEHRAFFSVFNIEDIEESTGSVQEWRKPGSREFRLFEDISMDIVSPFLLSVGNIYPIREKILNALEQDEEGEERYSELMQQLQILERPNDERKGQDKLPHYEYPKTIEEGKKYFLKNKQL